MQLFANNASSRLVAGISNSSTSLQVTAGDGSKFPSPTGSDYFLVTLCKIVSGVESSIEIVKVTARSSDTFTIVRAQEGTTALAYATDDFVQLRITAASTNAVESHLANVSNPHATTKAQVGLGNVDNTADTAKPVSTAQQTALNLKLNLAGGTMSGDIAMGGMRVTGLATPTNSTHAATKGYADGLLSGIINNSGDSSGTTWSSSKIIDALKNGAQVTDFGAVGNGSTNDTVAIQAAINSGAKVIVFPAGYTFVTDELTSYAADTTFYAVGATILLKLSSTAYRTLTINHARCTVIGGTWDGNKANQTAGDAFSSWAVGIHADDGAVYDATIKNFRGSGVKVVGGNRCTVERCRITDIGYSTSLTCFGIYMETLTGVSLYGNKARDNFIQLNNNGLADQGILFTSASTTGGEAQFDWEISGNTVYGSTNASANDLAINLAVRGHRGKVIGNVTTGGSMGWSEGGDKTIIEDNTFLDTVGTVRWGIEPSGKQMVIGNNILTGHLRGICFSFDNNNDIIISGNSVETDGTGNICIAAEISATGTGKNVTIVGNVLKGRRGVVATRETQGINIVGNTFVGPGSATSGSRFVFFDTPTSTTMFANIKANKISACERAVSVYSASVTTYTDIAFNDNNCRDDVAGGVFAHVIAEGSALLGSRIKNFNNEQNSTSDNFAMLFDNTNKRGIEYSNSYSTPEGSVTAGVGSLYVNLAGGGSPVLWTKNSGTGNTGWEQIVSTTATQTLTNKTLGGFAETVYAVADAAGVPISPVNGSIQTWTLGANRTPTAGTWAAGQSVTLMIADGTAYSVTWTTLGVVWVGGTVPSLPTTGYGVIELWKVGSTIYGASVGSVA